MRKTREFKTFNLCSNMGIYHSIYFTFSKRIFTAMTPASFMANLHM